MTVPEDMRGFIRKKFARDGGLSRFTAVDLVDGNGEVVVAVVGCADCPFNSDNGYMDPRDGITADCHHPMGAPYVREGGDRHPLHIDHHARVAPDDCPLRRDTVTIRFAVAGDGESE